MHGTGRAPGRSLWNRKEPRMDKHKDKPVERKAKAMKDGVIEVDGTVPDVAGTLIVVVVRRP